MDGPAGSEAASRPGFVATVRAGDWWSFKLIPLLGIFYLTVLRSEGSILDRWPRLLLLLGALAAGAAFVSLLNDFCDLADDAAAGKPNRLAGRSRTFAFCAIGSCLLIGALIGLALPRDPVVLSAYGCAWIAFALYSIPPVRLKVRGGWGLIADAAGSSLFPALLAARLAGAEDVAWLILVGLWAFAFGVRGIAWHQLGDEGADRRAGVATIVLRRGRAATIRLAHFLVVPAELGALTLLLFLASAAAPLVAVVLYAGAIGLRREYFWEKPTFVIPQDRSLMIGRGFYDLFLPVSILLALAMSDRPDALVLAAHLIVFSGPVRGFLADVVAMWRCHRARRTGAAD